MGKRIIDLRRLLGLLRWQGRLANEARVCLTDRTGNALGPNWLAKLVAGYLRHVDLLHVPLLRDVLVESAQIDSVLN